MGAEFFQVRTAQGALLAEYWWHPRMDCLVQRFAFCWAGFVRDGFVANPTQHEHINRLVELGTLLRVPEPTTWRLQRLHTTKIKLADPEVHVLSVCEVGESATNYIVQQARLPQLTTDEIVTRSLTDSASWAYDSWRGAIAQVGRIVEQTKHQREWETQDHSHGNAWPAHVLEVLSAQRAAEAAKPAQTLNAGEFAARMRAMRAKGVKL